MTFRDVSGELRAQKNSEKAFFLGRFFKTGEGEYAQGDAFLGLTVPQSRSIAKKFRKLPLSEVQQLLHSKFHEERLVALLILTEQFKTNPDRRGDIVTLYLENTKYINNWDLVDLSAPNILGMYLLDKDRTILKKLAHSKNLWEKRIAILSTLAFIVKNGEHQDTFEISNVLLNDEHDLIHKAVGWMLREVGKRVSEEKEEEFLRPRYKKMPRTMLRYSIERFGEEKRQRYLQGTV